MNIINSLQRGTSAFNDIELKLKAKGVIGQEIVPVEDYPERIDDIVSDLQTKSVTVSTNGSSEINPDSGYDGLEKVNLTVAVPVPTIEQNKTATISQNGTTTINPSSGNDAMDSVEVTVDVPTPTFNDLSYMFYEDARLLSSYKNFLLASLNAGNIDNLKYAFNKATINDQVLDLTDLKLNTTNNTPDLSYAFDSLVGLIKEIAFDLEISKANLNHAFSNNTGLEKVSGLNIQATTANFIDVNSMFYGCSNLDEVTYEPPEGENPNWILNNTGYGSMFQSCVNLTYVPDLTFLINSGVVNFVFTFGGCSSLKYLDITIDRRQGKFSMLNMFNGCSKLEEITGDLDMSYCNNFSNAFTGCSALTTIETSGSLGGSVTDASLTLDLSAADSFDADSFIDNLASNDSGNTRIIILHADAYSRFTKQAEATTKNYTVQSA